VVLEVERRLSNGEILVNESVPRAGERVRVCAGWALMPGIFARENRRTVDLWGVWGVWVAGAESDDRTSSRGNRGEKRCLVASRGIWQQNPTSCSSFPSRPVGIFVL